MNPTIEGYNNNAGRIQSQLELAQTGFDLITIIIVGLALIIGGLIIWRLTN